MPSIARYPATDSIAVDELRLPASLAQISAVAARTAGMRTFDTMVRRLLPRLELTAFGPARATIYDAVHHASPEVGGHWTLASRSIGPLDHSISSYSVALAFDDENLPDHFVITGAREVVTTDARETSLATALDQARDAGPLRTGAPHAFLGFAL